VKTNTEAIEIKRSEKIVVARTSGDNQEITTISCFLHRADRRLCLHSPGVAKNHVFKLWTIPDMDRIHKFIEENKPTHAVIAGGGFIGLEMAEALSARGLKVTIVEAAPQVMISMDAEFRSHD